VQGVVVKYNEEKGYGFIRSSQFEEDLFVHISNVKNRDKLATGQNVEFNVEETPKGLAATSVVAGQQSLAPSLTYGSIALTLTLLIVLLLQQFPILLSYLVAINSTTFLLYGYDKYLSQTDKLRIPEKLLHLLAILGGSPAGLIAQRFFKHKTLKISFQVLYWGIVLTQILIVYLVL